MVLKIGGGHFGHWILNNLNQTRPLPISEVCPEIENVHQGSPGSLGSPDTYDKIYTHSSLRSLA